MNARLVALCVLIGAGVSLAVGLWMAQTQSPLDSSLAPAYRILGEPVKALDHLIARALPIDDVDEEQLGVVLRLRYETTATRSDPDVVYVNDLIDQLETYAKKPFDYKAYVIDDPAPNAMALPGGVIVVTRGLLVTLGSESELVAVLAHELGHIEREHCFDAVKFQLLARKLGSATLGHVADFAVTLLASHSFSKAQEGDADEYAYTLLLEGPYDPRGVGQSFGSLLRSPRPSTRTRADPIRDYILSHPPLEIREARFLERAEAWWRRHPDEKRYVGARNLSDRQSYADAPHTGEWALSRSEVDTHTKCYGYSYGAEGLPQDYERAFEWCSISAENGISHGQTLLAELYEHGNGVALDYQLAAYWYGLAAEAGHAHAQLKYGVFLVEGTGIAPDREAGLAWIRRADSPSNPDAANVLKDLAESGKE